MKIMDSIVALGVFVMDSTVALGAFVCTLHVYTSKSVHPKVAWCVFVFLCGFYRGQKSRHSSTLCNVSVGSKEDDTSESTVVRGNGKSDTVVVGYCFKCKEQARLPWHCDRCGGGSGTRYRHYIVQHVISAHNDEYICTKCCHLSLYPHHCAFCSTNRGKTVKGIVKLRRS